MPVLGVIDPGAAAARAASHTGDVLVIATDATVHSHAYAAACQELGLRALEKACPLLVPLVEEGWTEPTRGITAQVIEIYLAELLSNLRATGLNPDTLVLGCTHYPLLRPLMETAVPAGMRVIDSAESAAEAASRLFSARCRPVRLPDRRRSPASRPTRRKSSSGSARASWAAPPARSSWSTWAADSGLVTAAAPGSIFALRSWLWRGSAVSPWNEGHGGRKQA